ncbi:radical SAM protein [Candidatus Woesearchaeota archaeon]|nr:radical SAM protein [Candidatus Woesearchaeota archaeon]
METIMLVNEKQQQETQEPNLIYVDEKTGIPLIGLIHIGVIDRGSNLLQIRTSTVCNMNCIFCSTDAGVYSKQHKKNFLVDPEYVTKYIKEMVQLKQCDNIEINVDSVGEPSAYPYLQRLLENMKTIPEVKTVSMQTNGTLVTKEKIQAWEQAGLRRLNWSLHSLDPEKAKYLFGNHAYNLTRVEEMLKEVINSKIELNLTPVYLPGINDEEMIKIIQLAKKLNCRLSIQKYETYKYSRKENDAERLSWFKFYRQLEEWEKQFSIKLKCGPHDFNITRTKKIPLVFRKGDIIYADIKAPGWFPKEMVAASQNRAITIVDAKGNVGDRVKVKILSAENSIYLAKQL